jgi:hypothetical protein
VSLQPRSGTANGVSYFYLRNNRYALPDNELPWPDNHVIRLSKGIKVVYGAIHDNTQKIRDMLRASPGPSFSGTGGNKRLVRNDTALVANGDRAEGHARYEIVRLNVVFRIKFKGIEHTLAHVSWFQKVRYSVL